MKKSFIILMISLNLNIFSQEKSIITTEISVNPLLNGTLFSPEKTNAKTKLVILIAGSGPTDRNGNQTGAENNSLKFMSENLAKAGIAVFSYDKRIIAQMKTGNVDEKNLSFEDFIEDAKTVIKFFKTKNQFSKIIVAGHSEGALIGAVAANNLVDAYISLDGAGRPIDQVISEQIQKQAPTMKEEVQNYFEILKSGKTFELKNKMLASIFRESVQPYMISWIKYNPQTEIKKLNIPVLIINGTKDIQVSVEDANLLKTAKGDAKLEIINDMNHIFKEIKGDNTENLASYNNSNLPIIPQLSAIVTSFIKSL